MGERKGKQIGGRDRRRASQEWKGSRKMAEQKRLQEETPVK
jgi:hypothetical protein